MNRTLQMPGVSIECEYLLHQKVKKLQLVYRMDGNRSNTGKHEACQVIFIRSETPYLNKPW